VEENWHGVWGGYSYDSIWQGNRFARNAEAIAIEHGQGNRILENTFDRDATAIRLWQNATQDPNWSYPKHRDTRSQDYTITANTFQHNQTALSLRDTTNVRAFANTYTGVEERTALAGDTSGLQIEPAGGAGSTIRPLPDVKPLAGGMDPMIKDGERRGRDTIIVDGWGPYDWKSPKLWPVIEGGAKGLPFPRRSKAAGVFDGPLELKVLGPEGTWKLVSARGASVAPPQGKVGDVITVTPRPGGVVDYEVTLSYVGGPVVSPRGVVSAAGTPYLFGYSRFFASIPWTIRFFSYPEAADPARHPDAFARVLRGEPVGPLLTTDRIDYLSGGVIEDGVPPDRFAFVAEGTVALPRGDYTLQVISDDGARVWVDGTLVLDAWAPHESRVDEVIISGGRHRLKVEYYEVGGWSEMRFDIQPRRARK
jgi:hypothetical protein